MAVERRPRGPGITYSALSLVMLVFVGVIALTATQPPPPTIAEFAPQALEVIEDSPSEQSSEFGSGEGGQDGDLVVDPATGQLVPRATPPPIDVPRVRRCVGDPPRQIEDPQSPPCVPYWSGNNGGTTYKGVTGTEIRVAGLFQGESGRILESFFNSRFELYGRRFHLVGTGASSDCVAQKEEAARLDIEAKVFAVLDTSSNASRCLYLELARRKLLSINAQVLVDEANDMRRLHPYLWQYDMGYDQLFDGIGSMICSRLAGHPARHTTDPTLLGDTRKFGLILHYNHETEPIDLDPINRGLERCNVELAATRAYYPDPDDSAQLQADHTNAILEMKTKEVTSVICLCAIFTETALGPTATAQSYFPEWIVSSWGSNDYNLLVKLFWPPEHRRNMLGVTSHNRQLNTADEPAYWALREVDPNVSPQAADNEAGNLFTQYRAMLLLASGVQMAGPNLTPDTFASALQRTRFPNPEHRNLPSKVGFAGKHGMTSDFAEYWWSENARSPDGWPNDGTRGAFCYVDGGQRRRADAWPSQPDPFFSGPCVTGA